DRSRRSLVLRRVLAVVGRGLSTTSGVTMPELTIGLDPGSSGGMACIINGTVEVMKFENATEADIAERLQDWAAGDCFAYLERVGPNRQKAEGERRQGASTMFTFGRNYGFLRGILIASKVPFEEVTPQKWQKPF